MVDDLLTLFDQFDEIFLTSKHKCWKSFDNYDEKKLHTSVIHVMNCL